MKIDPPRVFGCENKQVLARRLRHAPIAVDLEATLFAELGVAAPERGRNDRAAIGGGDSRADQQKQNEHLERPSDVWDERARGGRIGWASETTGLQMGSG